MRRLLVIAVALGAPGLASACSAPDVSGWNACVSGSATSIDLTDGVDYSGGTQWKINTNVSIQGPNNACTATTCPILPPLIVTSGRTVTIKNARVKGAVQVLTLDADVTTCKNAADLLRLPGLCLLDGSTHLTNVHVVPAAVPALGLYIGNGQLHVDQGSVTSFIGTRAVMMTGGWDVAFHGTSFYANNAGAIDWTNGTLVIDQNATFTNNSTLANGAAIYAHGSSTPITLTDVTFTANQATGAGALGGAIFSDGEGFAVTRVTFDGNQANSEGGAAFLKGAASTITSSTFQNNAVVGALTCRGGALRTANATLTVNSTAFNVNRISGACPTSEGGAVSLIDTTADLHDTTFNGSMSTTAVTGGFVHVTNGQFVWRGGQAIAGSVTGKGGAATFVHAAPSGADGVLIEGVLFGPGPLTGPLASDGGYLALLENTSGVIRGARFRGGAIAAGTGSQVRHEAGGLIKFQNDQFCGARGKPAVDLVSTANGFVPPEFTNDVFYANEAGAISQSPGNHTSLKVFNNTFVDNDTFAGVTPQILVSDYADLEDNIFLTHSSSEAAIQTHPDGAGGAGSNNLFFNWGPNPGTWVAPSYWLQSGRNNVYADPMFLAPRPYTAIADCDQADFHLSYDPTSPAIDAGTSSITDPDGSPSDLGAYGGAGAQWYAPASDPDGDGVSNWLDCSDTDPNIKAPVRYGVDDDGDGYGTKAFVFACSPRAGLGTLATDCNDADTAVSPGASEICDGIDNNCNNQVDDADPGVINRARYFPDADHDGYGDIASPGVLACAPPAGTVTDRTDCNDADINDHPSNDEVCDGHDNNCDGLADDADPNLTNGTLYYVDADHDTHGNGASTPKLRCTPATGYASSTDDCDDANPSILGPKAGYADGDGDGHGDAASPVMSCASVASHDDCDDLRSFVHPGAPEVCDGRDDDCDGTPDDNATNATTWYHDGDGDLSGDNASTLTSCDQPATYVSSGGDCNDADPAYHPGAIESCSTLVDLNCDGHAGGTDSDGDGFAACADCNDGDPAIHPGAVETCDGADDDCNDQIDDNAIDATTWYADDDGDLYGRDDASVDACDAPEGYASAANDCDDTDPTIHPGAPEACDATHDFNCDGSFGDVDADSDGYAACLDCNDDDPDVHPGAAELPGDGIDQDCDGSDATVVDTGDTGDTDVTDTDVTDTDVTDTGVTDTDVPFVPTWLTGGGPGCDSADGARVGWMAAVMALVTARRRRRGRVP